MNDDQKMKDLLAAYTKTPPSEAFVQNVMRTIRHEPTFAKATVGKPSFRLREWFMFPRVMFTGAAVAAAVFLAIPRTQEPVVIVSDDTPPIIYTASLLESAVDVTVPADTETEALIETYFL